MFNRFIKQVTVRPKAITSATRNVRSVPSGVSSDFIHFYGSFPARLFSTTPAVSKVSRNVERFAPILNTFATQYIMADNKDAILQDLAAKSSKCGFDSLEQAALNYLKEPGRSHLHQSVQCAFDFGHPDQGRHASELSPRGRKQVYHHEQCQHVRSAEAHLPLPSVSPVRSFPERLY